MSRLVGNKPIPRIAFVVTVDLSMKFFDGQTTFLAANGFQIDLISSPGPRLEARRREGITPSAIKMEREITLVRDVISLWRLWRLFRRLRPDMVVAGTPKAGLLGTVAARLAGVPYVQYALLGLRLETTSGIKRRILMATERIACHAADCVCCISRSLMDRTVALGLAPASRCKVIGSGTIDGVDIERYAVGPRPELEAGQIRSELHIPIRAPVIGFAGRITRDKGIGELYEAFTRLKHRYPDLLLLLVGDFEAGDPVPGGVRRHIEADPAVIRPGFVDNAEKFYRAMDVMALPTYREGIPMVLLEAQAAAVPVVTTDATGAMDAIVDGETGFRVPVGDADALTAALDRLLADADLRSTMGAAGRNWVEKNFRREDLWRELLAHYRMQLRRDRDRTTGRPHSGNSRMFDVQEDH